MNKQLLNKKSSAQRLLAVWLTIFMLGSLALTSKAQTSGGGSATPVPNNSFRSGLKSSTGTVKLNGGEAISWDAAMNQLTNGVNTIELQEDVTFATIPTKACTITGAEFTLTYSGDQLNLLSPITFKNIKLNISKILAQGNALTFDEGVSCLGDNNRINNIWAGGSNTDVAETNLTIKSGSFGWIYAGSGSTGKVGSTHLTIEGGTVYGDIFGGSYAGESTTTNITIKGGTIKSGGIYGGGWNDKVGTTIISIVDGEIEGSVFGGGSGDGPDYSVCGNTNVTVIGGHIGVRLYGGGSPGQVTGTARVVVTGGRIDGAIFGGGGQYNSVYDYHTTATCQNTDISIGGAQLGYEGLFAGGDAGKVLGNAKLTFTGDLLLYDSKKPTAYAAGQWATCGSAEIILIHDLKDKLAGIAVNTAKAGSAVTNGAKLTFKDLGTGGSAYDLPWNIEGFKTLSLDNTYLKAGTKKIVVDPATIVTTFEGTGFISPVNVDTKSSLSSPTLLFMANATTLPEPTIFTGTGNLSGKNIFRANHTYRLTTEAPADFKTITFTPTANDTLTVSVDTTKLISGDKIPTGVELTARAASQYHYLAKVKKNDLSLTSNTFTVAEDANLTMEVIEYLDLAEQKQDVTISKKEGIWQYLTKAITRTPAEPDPINFNGTVKNTLEAGKIVDIDGTCDGKLTFASAVINSNTRSDAALTVKSGANVTISGNLEVKANEGNNFAILNNGVVIINTDGAIKANNTVDTDKGICVVNGATMVISGTGASLESSGLDNQGTVVAKEGSTVTNSNSGAADLLKTYVVIVTDPGNGNKIVIKAANVPVVSNDKVTVNTVLTINGAPASNYTLEEITVTTADGTEKILDGGTYTMPEKEVTFAATFKQSANPPYVPTYYNIYLPTVKGVKITPKAGAYVVEEGYNFSFSLELEAGYESSSPVVKANDVVIIPHESDGKYILRNIVSNMNITIEGIDTPTGNAAVEGVVEVQTVGPTLHIYLPKEETVFIYTASGLLYRELQLSSGDTQIELSRGIYFVKIAGKTYKIAI